MRNLTKLRLHLDDLHVESFETAEVEAERGTVEGYADTATGDRRGCACDSQVNTCWGGCAPSQAYSCPGQPGCDDGETRYMTCMDSCGWQGGVAVLFPNC